ncbi:MAG: restriction endonuclease [Chloroflexi bacterium]|nr:MAG: restriction endonuclease [Chloroflexota bacterium]
MPLPDYQSLMRPLLEVLNEHGELLMPELRDRIAVKLGLSPDDLAERMPSGGPLWHNRVHWARTYLLKAGAIDSPRRGLVKANARSLQLLAEDAPVDTRTLARFAEFNEWRARSEPTPRTDAVTLGGSSAPSVEDVPTLTPRESLDGAHREIKQALLDTLLERVRTMDPTDFERLVLQLVLRLGYGGPTGDAVHLGRSGDNGVDGVIYEDRLRLDRVYLQAKRWAADVSEGNIRDFVGSLVGKHADRGVFITTSMFSGPARDFVNGIQHRIALIDGLELANLMWETNLGLTIEHTYDVKTIDTDFFERELE